MKKMYTRWCRACKVQFKHEISNIMFCSLRCKREQAELKREEELKQQRAIKMLNTRHKKKLLEYKKAYGKYYPKIEEIDVRIANLISL